MKRFHNPMTLFMIIVLSIMAVSISCFLIFSDNLPPILYLILPCFVFMIVLLTIWGEYKFKKTDEKLSEEYGVNYNTAENTAEIIKRGPKKVVILTVIVTLAVIGGFVALFMCNALLGLTLFIIFCFTILFYPFYKAKTITTIEKYISSKRGTMRSLLQLIHNQILEIVPNAVAVIDKAVLFPTYIYIRNIEKSEIYSLISVQAIIGGKSVCIYPNNPDIFIVFADRINSYKNNGFSELYMPTHQSLDLDLIRNIVKFNMAQIELMSGNAHINEHG